ncbi:hypothetical protein GCM10027421_08340 [Microbacterium shaanxiense]
MEIAQQRFGTGTEGHALRRQCGAHVIREPVDDRVRLHVDAPASLSSMALSSRPFPTSCSACSCDQVPPKDCTIAVSAAIQYGSVSTSVPSMSQRTARGF